MLKIIEEISKAKTKEKIKILKENPQLKEVLVYAYDPFIKYFITAPTTEGQGEEEIISDDTRVLLNHLQQRTYGTKTSLDIISRYMEKLTPDSAELLQRVINKDLQCNINIKTINKAFPKLISLVYNGSEKPPLMLLKNYEKKKCEFPCLVAVKKDGVRARFINGEFITRQGKKIIGVEHLEEQLKDVEYELDGEMCVPGLIFDEASGLIRSEESTPEAVYHMFDITDIDDTKMNRYYELVQLKSNYLAGCSNIEVIQHLCANNEEELIDFYNKAVEDGEEGIVIYKMDSLYEDKRSYDWMRLVPKNSEDLEVIGFFEGRGKYAFTLGGIIVDRKGKAVKVGTGFKDVLSKKEEEGIIKDVDKKVFYSLSIPSYPTKLEDIYTPLLSLRKVIWRNNNMFIGVKAKIEYKEKTKAGSLRQPRFKGWRFDK